VRSYAVRVSCSTHAGQRPDRARPPRRTTPHEVPITPGPPNPRLGRRSHLRLRQPRPALAPPRAAPVQTRGQTTPIGSPCAAAHRPAAAALAPWLGKAAVCACASGASFLASLAPRRSRADWSGSHPFAPAPVEPRPALVSPLAGPMQTGWVGSHLRPRWVPSCRASRVQSGWEVKRGGASGFLDVIDASSQVATIGE
jgi:hypothetical protein